MNYKKWLDDNFDGDKTAALFVLADGIKFFTALRNDPKQRAFAELKIAESKKFIVEIKKI